VVRLSLTGTPRPRAHDLVTITDALRATCVKALTTIRDGTPAVSLLAGKDAAGQPLHGHQHAHFLALTDNGYTNGLVIWAPGGLRDDELEALTRLAGRTIGAPEGVPGPRGLHVRVSGHGGPELLPAALTGPAATWISATPFIPSHHRSRHQDTAEYLHTEIERELHYRDVAPPVRVTQLTRPEWILYTRHRFTPHRRPGQQAKTAGTRDEGRRPYGIRIEFSHPIPGPLALGALSHFGLGLFSPEHPALSSSR
jgi:CRISPR-associated protein Csb2